jgi:cell division septation protein DedD
MARNGSRGGGERVLESRHLVGLFLGVVLLCGVFFTLGYVMGRNQFGGSVHAAESASRNASSPKYRETDQPAATPENPFPEKTANAHLESASPAKSPVTSNPPPKPNAVAPTPTSKPPVTDTKTAQHNQTPVPPKPGILLQVAALRRQSDALEMAEAIQQKKLPGFVVTPGPDNFYRVQVGPYQDMAAAEAAKRALEQFGFKPIIKH